MNASINYNIWALVDNQLYFIIELFYIIYHELFEETNSEGKLKNHSLIISRGVIKNE